MKIILSDKKHKLFIKLMASYILILLAAILIGIFGYSAASRIVEKDIKNANLSMLNQSKNIMDEKLSTINTAAMQIADNSTLKSFLDESEDQENFYLDSKNIVQELKSYKLNLDRNDENERSIIYDYYIYAKRSEYIVNTETINKSDFYYNNILKSNIMSFEEWNKKILDKSHGGDFYSDTLTDFDNHRTIGTIMYTQSMPLFFNKESKGTLVVILNKASIDALFSNVDISKGGYIYIQDKNGNIISSIVGKSGKLEKIDLAGHKASKGIFNKTIDNKKMIVTYTTSTSNNGWKYVLVLPNSVVMGELNNFQRFILAIILITIIIGVSIAYYLAYHNSQPVNKIFSRLIESIGEDESKFKDDDVFNSINSTLTTLITNNISLQQKIENQKPLLLNAFIDRLLKGEFNNINEISANSSYIGVNMEGEQYAVLVLRIYDRSDVNEINEQVVQELNTAKVLLREAFSRYLDNKTYYHDIDSQSMAVVVFSGKNDAFRKELSANFENLFNEFAVHYRLKMLIAIGNIYTSILDVWRSYQEALETINYVQFHENGKIKWYDEIPRVSQSFYYPIDFEQRIINYAKSGEFEQITKLLNIIYDENYNKRKLTINMHKQLFYDLKGTIIKLTQQILSDDNINERVRQLDFQSSIHDNFENIISIYDNICRGVIENKSDRNTSVINKIINYIETNYMKQDLSLTMVASEFHFSEGYLSYFFKEQTGQNFTDFVEQVRMNEACLLLKNTKSNIDEIAEKVGYNSVQSFRRAFKRIKGVSPSAIRSEQ